MRDSVHAAGGGLPGLPPAVLLGGEANALSIARGLSRLGARVYLLSGPDTCARHSRHCRWLPLAARTGEEAEEAYARFLLGPEASHLSGAVVLACNDAGIQALAKNRAALSARYRLDESNPKAQLQMLDKLTTYRHALAAGVDTPRFWLAESRQHVLSLREELVFPLLVKPRLAHRAKKTFKTKHRVVDRFEDLLAAYDAERDAAVDVLLMEHIPGPDSELCSYYTYLDEAGNTLFDFTKRVVRRYPAGMGLGCYHVTDWVPQIVEPAKRLFRQAGLRGLGNVEFKRDPRDGRYKLIECNARFTAADCLVKAAGYDLGAFVYRRVAGLPQPPLGEFRRGLHLWDPLVDGMAFAQLHGQGNLSLWGWVASLIRPQTFPYFRWLDPMPAVARARKMARAALGRRGAKQGVDEAPAPAQALAVTVAGAARVCMHSPSVRGGQPLYVRELITALVRHRRGGHRFEWVSGEDLEPQFRTGPYPVHPVLPRLPHKSEFKSRIGWALNRLRYYPRCDGRFLRWLRGRPDIAAVHFQEFSRSLPALMRRLRRRGKKIFYTVHNIRPHAYPPLVPKWLWDRRNRQACLLSDRLIVHTERLRDELSSFLGGPNSGHPPIDVAPHGVWTVREPVAPPPLNERLGWKRLLFFGTVRRNKGLDLLFRAADLLPGFSFTIAGEAREAEYFHDEVVPQVRRLREAGVGIELLDRFIPEPEVAALFARHSAIVLPYTQEFTAQSGVVFLALAHELPVVASEAGGLKDLFGEFAIGATFGQATPDALASAVRRLFAGANREELAAQIRAARGRFSWRASAGATLTTYAAGGAGAGVARAPDGAAGAAGTAGGAGAAAVKDSIVPAPRGVAARGVAAQPVGAP